MTDNERLARLETKFEERWNNHDKRSEERLDEIKGSMSRIELRLDKLPCFKHIEQIHKHESFISGATKALWVLYGLTLGALVKAFIK